jgi:hypothetical protein
MQTFITNVVAISHRYLTSKISIRVINLLDKNYNLISMLIGEFIYMQLHQMGDAGIFVLLHFLSI